VISLKKYMEMRVEELLRSTLDSYRAALAAMGNCGTQACPHLGDGMQQSLLNLRERLSPGATPEEVTRTEQQVEKELEQWGEQASRYFEQKTSELREIVMIMARTAQEVGERDQRYARQFNEFAARLQTIAGMDDLTQMRQSLTQSAADLKGCVDRMEQDGQESVASLRAELSTYQTRLEEAEKLAGSDPLTGLDNRRKVEARLDFCLRRALPFSVLMFDLNGFKEINDLHGHLAGDELLVKFASELRAQFRKTDTVGRWGGDEFIVLLDCDLNEARAHIERIREWVFGDYTVGKGIASRKVRVEAAIGAAQWRPGEAVADVIQRADADMYKQKRRLAPRR